MLRNNVFGPLSKCAITAALCAATFGSYKLALAMTNNHVVNLQPMKFPTELQNWYQVQSTTDIVKPDVIAHRFRLENDIKADIVVRTTLANAVLHDLTSCLINAQAAAKVVGTEKLQTKKGLLSASIVEYTYKAEPTLAVMWFQAKNESAPDRWSWRAVSATSTIAREAPQVHQAEVSAKISGDKKVLLQKLEALSKLVFEELEKH
jgi:hypothetical protein